MKIAYVSPNSIYPYDSSGAEKTIEELLTYLAENNSILALCTNEKYLLNTARFTEVLSYDVVNIMIFSPHPDDAELVIGGFNFNC